VTVAPEKGGRPGARLLSARQRGQSLVEFAFTTTIAISVMMAILQISLIIVQQYSAAQVARRTARYLAVNLDATDATVRSKGVGFASGLPGLDTTGTTWLTTSPSCPGANPTAVVDPPVDGTCTNRDQGDAVTVTVTYSPSTVMFLPVSYGIGTFRVSFPTGPFTISYTVLLE